MTDRHKEPAEWDLVNSGVYADCRIYQIAKERRCHPHTGQESDFYVQCGNDWVQSIGLTKNQEIILIRQFRFGSENLSLEIPGGVIDPGEQPLDAAKRELWEETGFLSDQVVELAWCYPNPAIQRNKLYYVLLTDCEDAGSRSLDGHEEIQVLQVSLDEAFSWVKSGTIRHGLVVGALFFLKQHLEG